MNIVDVSKTVCFSLLLALLAGSCARLNPNTENNIDSALEAKRGAFQACYEDALDRNQETQGMVALQLTIDAQKGDVTSSTVAQTNIDDEEMPSCVAHAAEDITLSEPPGVRVDGQYEFVFELE